MTSGLSVAMNDTMGWSVRYDKSLRLKFRQNTYSNQYNTETSLEHKLYCSLKSDKPSWSDAGAPCESKRYTRQCPKANPRRGAIHSRGSQLSRIEIYHGRLSRSEFHDGQVPLKASGSCSWCWYSWRHNHKDWNISGRMIVSDAQYETVQGNYRTNTFFECRLQIR